MASLVGRLHERDLYLTTLTEAGSWPETIERPSSAFVVLTALDTRETPDDALQTFATRLLSQGCRYSCSWGPGCGRIELAVDMAWVDAMLAGRPYPDVVTTSHADESLDEALFFALFLASPADMGPVDLLAISDPQWSAQVEGRLADPGRLEDELPEE